MNRTLMEVEKSGMATKRRKTTVDKDNVLRNLEKGMTVKAAFFNANVGRGTFYRWMKSEKFADQVEKARRKAERLLLEAHDKAAKERNDPKAYQWRLARLFPAEYGDRKEVKVEASTNVVSNGTEEVLSMLQQIKDLDRERSAD